MNSAVSARSASGSAQPAAGSSLMPADRLMILSAITASPGTATAAAVIAVGLACSAVSLRARMATPNRSGASAGNARGDQACHAARTVRSWQPCAGRESDSPGPTPPHARCRSSGTGSRRRSLGSRRKNGPRARRRSNNKLRALSTVATCRCCSCRGPEQHLDITPRPCPKIGEADTDHQPLPRGRRTFTCNRLPRSAA